MMKGVRFDDEYDIIPKLVIWATRLDEMTKRISVAYHNVDIFAYRKEKMRLKAITSEAKKHIRIAKIFPETFNENFARWYGMSPDHAKVAIENEVEPVIQRADAKWDFIKEQLKEQGRW